MAIHRWLDFKVTARCNNYARKCGYCDVPVVAPTTRDVLSLDVIHRVLLDARALGFDTFWILGGEPTLRGDAAEILDPLCDDPRVTVTVVTNGKAHNPDLYRAVFATRARRACIQVSLDTLKPNNLKRADPAASLALVADLNREASTRSRPGHDCGVEVHAVISRENLSDFDEFVRFFAAKGVPVSLAMVCPWRMTPEPRGIRDFTPEEVLSVAERIEALCASVLAMSANRLVSEFIRRMLHSRERKGVRHCGAGLTHLVINADGAVHRCMPDSFKCETAIGNVLTDRLHSVLSRVVSPRMCQEGSQCYDGFAWDRLAMDW